MSCAAIPERNQAHCAFLHNGLGIQGSVYEDYDEQTIPLKQIRGTKRGRVTTNCLIV